MPIRVRNSLVFITLLLFLTGPAQPTAASTVCTSASAQLLEVKLYTARSIIRTAHLVDGTRCCWERRNRGAVVNVDQRLEDVSRLSKVAVMYSRDCVLISIPKLAQPEQQFETQCTSQ
jgi:hypothetical protein